MDQTNLIRLDEVSKEFWLGEGNFFAVKELSTQIRTGEITAIMGPSGSGKSTLLNILGSLDFPTAGKMHINNINIHHLSKDEQADFRNDTIGFVFQSFNLIPVLTTIENVMIPAQISRKTVFDREVVEKRAKYLLTSVGLEKQINQPINRLSGGQMQRVSIARALINRPQIILADEPTANLDHDSSSIVLKQFRSLCNTENTTAIIATHDPAVLAYCDRVITMKDGRVIRDETT